MRSSTNYSQINHKNRTLIYDKCEELCHFTIAIQIGVKPERNTHFHKYECVCCAWEEDNKNAFSAGMMVLFEISLIKTIYRR